MTHFTRPRMTRGFLPLVAAAVGVGRAIYGAVEGNQRKQRNKGYIDANYRRASQQLDTDQNTLRQGSLEALNARGLLGGGDVSAIHSAMGVGTTGGSAAVMNPYNGKVLKAAVAPSAQNTNAPSTLGGQIQSDMEGQFGLERTDLKEQRDQAMKENKAQYTNTLIGSALQGAQAGMDVYGIGKDIAAARKTPAPAPAPATTIKGAFGIDPVDPLNGAGSAWNVGNRATISGEGQSIYNFNS